jgi:hypothetical protein
VATLNTDAACAAVGTVNDAMHSNAADETAINRTLLDENAVLIDIRFPPFITVGMP